MKTRKMLAGLLAASMLLTMAGCNKKTTPSSRHSKRTPKEETLQTGERPSDQTAIFELMNAQSSNPDQIDQVELKKAYSQFVFDVMKHCLKTAHGKNVLISSDSILFALDMAAAGADGDTLDQMLQTMMPGIPNEAGFKFGADRMKDLQNNELRLANSAWINQDLGGLVYDDYLSFVRQNFDSEVRSIKFDDNAVDTINKWVSEKTDGMIEELVDDLNADDLMILINAISFDAKWADQFEEHNIVEGEFTCHDGTKQTVQYLHGGSECTYLYSENMQGIMKYYEGGKYAFITMLPNDEKSDINEFMQNLDTDEYWEFWDSKNEGGNYHLVYQFPEFKTEYETSVAPALIDMGMTDAFDPDRANFSNMGSCPIYIGDVIHKTYIDVNRAGTTAAAATEIEMKCGAAMAPDETRYVICDRPFAYAIVDTATGLPVFLGTVETV